MLGVLSKVTAITIIDQRLVCAEFEKRGEGIKLLAIGQNPIPEGIVTKGELKKKHEFQEILKETLSMAKPHRIQTQEVIFILPESKSYFHLFHFPESLSTDEILQACQKEASVLIPFDPTQIYCDFYEVKRASGKEKRKEIVYIACPKDVANAFLEAFVGINLRPMYFGIETDGMSEYLTELERDTPHLFIVFKRNEGFLAIVDGNGIRAISHLSSTSQDMFFFDHCRQFISEYEEEEPDAKIASGAVISDSVRDKTNVISFEREMKMPFWPRNPWEFVKFNAADFPEEVRKSFGMGTMGILVANMLKFFGKGWWEQRLNLLPKSWRERSNLYQFHSFVTVVSIILIIVSSAFMSVFSFVWSQLYFDRGSARAEHGSASQILEGKRSQDLQNTITAFNAEVDILTQIQAKLISVGKMTNDLMDTIEPSIKIRGLTHSLTNNTYVLSGIAPKREQFFELKKNIEALPFVAEVQFPLSNLDEITDIPFTFTIHLHPNKLLYLSDVVSHY